MMRIILAILIAVTPTCSYGVWPDADRQDVPAVSILRNGGFENGRAGWTASGGTFATATSGSNLLSGKVSATWDSSAAAQELSGVAVAIPNGLAGQNGLAQCRIMTPTGASTHRLEVFQASNILAAVTITSSTAPTISLTNFIFPSSGNIQLRLVSVAADEPLIAIDDCYLGAAINLTSVSQATFVGGMEAPGASTCSYFENSSSGLSNYITLTTTGSGCGAWTVTSNGPGVISSQAASDHRLVYTNMPPGAYQIILNGHFNNNVAGTCQWRLTDGTNNYQPQVFAGSGGASGGGTLTFHVPSTTAGTRTFSLQAADNHAGTCAWVASADGYLSWKLYRFPTSAEQAIRLDQTNYDWVDGGAITIGATTTAPTKGNAVVRDKVFYKREGQNLLLRFEFQNGGTGSAAGSGDYLFTIPTASGCTIDTNRVGTVTTTSAAGQNNTVTVGAAGAGNPGSDAAVGVVSVYSTTQLRLIVRNSASSLLQPVGSGYFAMSNASVAYSAQASVPCVGWQENRSAPLLVGSVTSRSSGAVRTEGADVACATSSSITQQSGALSAIGNRASAACTLTILTGTFSATPWLCGVTVKGSTAGSTACTCASATSCTITGPSAADFNAYVHLQGPR